MLWLGQLLFEKNFHHNMVCKVQTLLWLQIQTFSSSLNTHSENAQKQQKFSSERMTVKCYNMSPYEAFA